MQIFFFLPSLSVEHCTINAAPKMHAGSRLFDQRSILIMTALSEQRSISTISIVAAAFLAVTFFDACVLGIVVVREDAVEMDGRHSIQVCCCYIYNCMGGLTDS